MILTKLNWRWITMIQQRDEPIKSAPLKNSRELAAMLKRLPKEERLRVEGIIIGVDLAHKKTPDDI